MTNNIGDFVATIANGNSLMRPSQFELSINKMPSWSTSSQFDGSQIRFYCNETQLPGVSIDTVDQRNYGMGYAEYFPTGVSFSELVTTFYADSQGVLIKFFNAWIRNVVNFDPSHGPAELFQIQYRDKYLSEVGVTQFDDQGNRILEYNYSEAFPVKIDPIAVRWFSHGEVTEFRVIWKYKVWTEQSIGASTRIDSFLQTSMPGNGLPGFSALVGNFSGIVSSNLLSKASSVVKFASSTIPGAKNIINTISGDANRLLTSSISNLF